LLQVAMLSGSENRRQWKSSRHEREILLLGTPVDSPAPGATTGSWVRQSQYTCVSVIMRG
ncbi:MAG: hypothetical protein ABTS22_04455, partial [Accumulibacter sp.]|uniref:hypothetical protein n=1 Tax=Accumulibacter sp. TaxID=2053492 RepID=UPI0033152ECA